MNGVTQIERCEGKSYTTEEEKNRGENPMNGKDVMKTIVKWKALSFYSAPISLFVYILRSIICFFLPIASLDTQTLFIRVSFHQLHKNRQYIIII